MNYEKHYTLLIEKGKAENFVDGEYYERHHILPKCMGGGEEPENFVKLTPEQHCLAHLLLVKIHPSISKLIYAANTLYNVAKNNKEFGWLRRRFAEAERIAKTGIPRSEESRLKQSKTMMRQYREGRINNRKGSTITEEHKRAISEANTGKIIKEESKSNLSGYILRYGDIEGPIKYKEHSLLKSTNLESMILKYGVELGTQKHKEMSDKKSLNQKGENNQFYGKTHTEESKKAISKKQIDNSGSRGKIWVNNGLSALRVFENEIPEGFVKGRGSRKLKSS